MIVGIDLGTTNSLIGRIEKGRPRLFEGANGSPLIPSVVHYAQDGKVLVGAPAKQVGDLSRTVWSAKRFIGRGSSDVRHWMDELPFDFSSSDDKNVRLSLGGKSLTPMEVSAEVLRELKRLAEQATGEEVKKAVITVPAYFNDSQRQATKFAGELAGLEVVRMVNEPTAACLAYGLDKKTKGLIAVFDLGGGTFDISILRVSDGIFEVLATNGDTSLGGDDFDFAIARGLATEASKAVGVDLFADRQTRADLVKASESLKRELTEKETANFRFELSGKTFEKSISRAQMNAWLEPILNRAMKPVKDCLADAKLQASQVTDVILVGGSTRTPLVRQFVKNIFSREPICSLNPDEVVAMGATVQANILAGQGGDMLLLDVIPLSLGIENMGGVVAKIIHRNSTIPISASESFTTYVDGQVSVDIHVVQGERELVKDNRSIARFQLKGIPPLPAGVPKIDVEFIVDANGILTVHAAEVRTGTTASVAVNPSYGLTDSEVETMLTAAFENAEGDFESRFLAEKRVEADSLVRATRKALERGADLLSAVERQNVDAALSALEICLSSSDRHLIQKEIERLNEVTHPLAERLINRAVASALKDKEIET